MAKSITQDGITFSKVKTAAEEGILEVSAGIKVAAAEGSDPEFGGIVNAVDIDWNGARLLDGTNIISSLNTFNLYAPNAKNNTTGEFCLKRCS